MSKKFIVFGQPSIGDVEIQEVVNTLKSGWIGTGPRVAQFEQAFAEFKGVEAHNVAAVNSCTAALHLSLIASGVGQGDEVITTALTFCATVNAIIHAGATPVLADVDPISMNIDVNDIERRITRKTRAVVPVHFAGRPCEMSRIMAIADRHGLKVIEDCAHSVEGEYGGQKTGTFGDFACFSFYVTKNVVTGEGGMVLARQEKDVARVKALALHGLSKNAWHRFGDQGYKHYQVVECGFKYNMMDIQAAIGVHQLARAEKNWCRRREIWNTYQTELADLPLERPPNPSSAMRHSFHLYTVRIDAERAGIERDAFLNAMTENGVGVGVHYLSIAEHPYYRDRYGWQPKDWPVARQIGRQTVSLPLSPGLDEQDVARVVSACRWALVGG